MSLPLKHDVSFVHTMTWLIAGSLLLCSSGGLAYGPRGWYDVEAATYPALIGQDAVTLVFGLPLLLVSAWLARRGSFRGLLCWMGALFYIAYFYYFYVVGIRFNPLFPVCIALVSMSMYSVLALLFAIDLERLKPRFNARMPLRLTGGFLIATALAFAALWISLIVSHLRTGTDLDPVSRFVIAVDGVVLLPLSFFTGIWLWRGRPLGYALAGIMLVKIVATFLTLIATSVVVMQWGYAADRLQTSMYIGGLILAMGLLVRCLQSVESNGSITRIRIVSGASQNNRPGLE